MLDALDCKSHEHRLPKPQSYFRVLESFAFIRNPGNDVYTTTTALCTS